MQAPAACIGRRLDQRDRAVDPRDAGAAPIVCADRGGAQRADTAVGEHRGGTCGGQRPHRGEAPCGMAGHAHDPVAVGHERLAAGGAPGLLDPVELQLDHHHAAARRAARQVQAGTTADRAECELPCRAGALRLVVIAAEAIVLPHEAVRRAGVVRRDRMPGRCDQVDGGRAGFAGQHGQLLVQPRRGARRSRQCGADIDIVRQSDGKQLEPFQLARQQRLAQPRIRRQAGDQRAAGTAAGDRARRPGDEARDQHRGDGRGDPAGGGRHGFGITRHRIMGKFLHIAGEA